MISGAAGTPLPYPMLRADPIAFFQLRIKGTGK
jgi:hypothetical protein